MALSGPASWKQLLSWLTNCSLCSQCLPVGLVLAALTRKHSTTLTRKNLWQRPNTTERHPVSRALFFGSLQSNRRQRVPQVWTFLYRMPTVTTSCISAENEVSDSSPATWMRRPVQGMVELKEGSTPTSALSLTCSTTPLPDCDPSATWRLGVIGINPSTV